VKRIMVRVGAMGMLMAGMALVVGAQGAPPRGGFGGRGPGPGGPMAGVFEFGGLRGGFGGKVVTGKPLQATFTITHTETLPGNTITNTTTGTFARAADGSTYRDVKFSAIGPWATSGKSQEFIYIRNVTKQMQYIVNVSKGTYRAFPIGEKGPKPEGMRGGKPGDSSNETVNDNPNGTYTDPVMKTIYPADDKLVTRTIPAGAIGNSNALIIISERWYSSALDILLEDIHTDPRFGTTTYQLSSIGQTPSASLFMPDPSFTQVQGGGFAEGHRGPAKEMPPPPPSQD
jgi:hypothetical protein